LEKAIVKTLCPRGFGGAFLGLEFEDAEPNSHGDESAEKAAADGNSCRDFENTNSNGTKTKLPAPGNLMRIPIMSEHRDNRTGGTGPMEARPARSVKLIG
jgi:hypothetical protein